jgi:membrane protein
VGNHVEMDLRTAVDRVAPNRPAEGWRAYVRRAAGAVIRALVDAFARNKLLTYANAIAFQLLIAIVALALFGLALLDLLALEEIWTDNVRPLVESNFLFETYLAINATVERVFATGSLTLLVLALLLAIWEVSGAVRAISGALNDIYETEETRPFVRRFATSFALAIAVIVCLVGAALTSNLIPRVDAIPSAAGQAIGWIAAIVLMGSAIWLLLRYAASVTRSAGWTSVGSIFVVVAWVIASLLFAFFVTDLASYRSATGNLVALLTLTAYIYTSSIIFLTGVQIDELLRRQATRGRKGLDALTTLDRPSNARSDGRSPRGIGRRSRVRAR